MGKFLFKAIDGIKLSGFIVLAAVTLLSAGCHLKGKKAPYLVIKGFDSPESVIATPEGDRFYVSNVGKKLEPSTKDGDGYITELSPEGEVLNKKFLPAEGVLHAPKGMAIVGRTLYVADIDRVVGFDLDTREQVFSLDFSGEKTKFLNDIAVMDDSTLLVSATDVGRIYSVSLVEGPAYTVLVADAPGVNGLFFDRDRLYTVGYGSGGKADGALWAAEFKDEFAFYGRLTGPVGLLDGIALLPDGRVVFSDWVAFGKPGALRAYDPETRELSTIELSEDVRGPADFYYDAKTNTVWLPRMTEGRVHVERLKSDRSKARGPLGY